MQRYTVQISGIHGRSMTLRNLEPAESPEALVATVFGPGWDRIDDVTDPNGAEYFLFRSHVAADIMLTIHTGE